MDADAITALAEKGFEAWAEEMGTGRTWEETGRGERAAWVTATRTIVEGVAEAETAVSA